MSLGVICVVGASSFLDPAVPGMKDPRGSNGLYSRFSFVSRERSPAEKPLLQNTYCTKLQCARNVLIVHELLVEAAGVEPASENVTGQETTCLFRFMPWALPQDVRDSCSERTRNSWR
jgi:hypothetical protein